MPITLITGPANAGKAGVVMDALHAHCARGERPLLIVPTTADVERYRVELDRREAPPPAWVERFEGLLAETLRRADITERSLGRLARERLLATAWGSPTPGVVRAVSALVSELEVERVSPDRLRAALDAWVAGDPAHAAHARRLGESFERYRGALEGLRPARASSERRAARALDALRRKPALWGATPVLLYGFDDFTRLQLDAIETLGAVVGAPVTVSLTYEPGRVAFASRGDTYQRLLPLAAEHRRLVARAEHYAPGARTVLHHLERHLFELDPPPPVPAGEAVRLLEGGGERAELELVAEEIDGLLARGVAPAEIAVAHRSPEAIAELLEEIFRAHRIPFALRRRLPFARSATGRALLGLLKAAFSGQPADGGASRGAGRARRGAGYARRGAGDWDGVGELDDGNGVGDLLAWLRAPGVLPQPEWADELELRTRRAGMRGVARARALWEADHPPLETLDRLRSAAHTNPAALIERTAEELRRLGFASALDACALAVGGEALVELGELARAAPQLAPDPYELIVLLRNLELVVGEEIAGRHDAVAVLDPLALRARRVRVLFLCGLQEGAFPAPAPPEPYLSEEERRGLAEASGLRLGTGGDSHQALARERYLLYAAVSRPWEQLVLSWHTADDDGLLTPRSLFVEDICDLLAGDPLAGDLHELHSRRALGEISAIVPAEAPQPPIAPLSDRRVLAELDERRPWSASGLQSWAGCPVRWFVERMLDARDLEPEAEPLARGGLAHAVLRQTFERLRDTTGSARLTMAKLPRARELLHAVLAEQADFDQRPLSTAPERVPGVRRRLEADLERYLEHAAACGERAEAGQQLDLAKGGPATPLEPSYLELPFGFPEAPDGLPPLSLGEDVSVRGYIDRVDLAPGGEAVVYDYKSGFPPPPDKWLSERSFQIALYMRAVEQLFGARVAGGFYQPLSGRDLRARGLLADGEGVVLDCVRGDTRSPPEVRELTEEVLAAAREAALQARAGALQPRPSTCGFGGSGCMYPSICRCDR